MNLKCGFAFEITEDFPSTRESLIRVAVSGNQQSADWRDTLMTSCEDEEGGGGGREVVEVPDRGGSMYVQRENEDEEEGEEEEDFSFRDSVHESTTLGGCLPCTQGGGGRDGYRVKAMDGKCLCGGAGKNKNGGDGRGCSSKWCCGVVSSTVKKTTKKF